MTPTDNLEPCRRCGQREGGVSANEGWFMVECQNCPQRTSNAHRSAEGAIAEWNRRTPTVNLEAGAGDLVERLNAIWRDDDHERLCQGREYSCTCGFDERTEATAREAAAQLGAVTAERDSWRRVAERCKSEAEWHSMEARTANNTIYEIYQAITGATGEPGNWHGAEPVREYITRSEAQLKAAREALERIRAIKYPTVDTHYALKATIDYARDQASLTLAAPSPSGGR